MTEAAHQIATNPLPPGKRVPGAVGLPSGCNVGIMNELGVLLPPLELGEVVIRGRNVTQGYENNPAANAVTFINGWCRTGDQGRLDADGYLFLNGRLKEIINRGGEKITPREIDDVLLSHPDIREAVAFAVPHPSLGENVAAAVVPRDGKVLTEVSVREYALARLPEFKVPACIVITSHIPKGPTGKLQRTGLASRLAQELVVSYEAPGNALEQLSADIFQQILQVNRVGRHDNFFALGGDSIHAMQVVARLIETLGVDVPQTTLFHNPSPASLAVELARLQQEHDIDAIAAALQDLPVGEADRLLRNTSGDV